MPIEVRTSGDFELLGYCQASLDTALRVVFMRHAGKTKGKQYAEAFVIH